MYSYIKGTIETIMNDSVEIESNGIGYRIYTPNPYSYQIGEFLTVYTYLHIKDEVLTLYGFREKEEKELFLKLISVSGIGPKSANAILATGSVSMIAQAINKGDAKYLTKFPGIGMKSAQQIILDLKGKLVVTEYSGNYLVLDEVHDALLALGYNEKDIQKVLPKLDSTKSTNQLIVDALGIMTR